MLPAPQIAFLSLSTARDPRAHRAANEWHQLDHRPENLALAGVAWGERFVLPPAAAADAEARGSFTDFHYANLYWLDEPHTASIQTWADFAEQSHREGRRPDIDLLDRPYMGFFRLVGTAVSPDSRMSARSLCFRPNTGLLLFVTSVPESWSRTEVHARNRSELDDVVPAMAAVPGIATVWCLESDPGLAPAEWSSRESARGTTEQHRLRVLVAATEIDPAPVVLARLHEDHPDVFTALDALPGRTEFRGAVETITPWKWDWFDEVHG
ncbi:hypothetical protein ACFTSD_20515 [Nocardiaceae bacterium NPDC056970]